MIWHVRARQRWYLCGIYTLLIVALQLISTHRLAPLVPPIPHLDKVAHFGMYGIYAVLLLWAAEAGRGRRGLTWALATNLALYCTVFGMGMEVAQATLTRASRAFSVADMVANALGAFSCAMTACRIWRRPGPDGEEWE